MATRPDKLPEWATQDETDPVSGQTNVVEPPAERKESGWTRREIPPRQWFNWLARYYTRWIEWARDEIDALDGRVTTNEDDITSLDGRVTTNEDDITSLDGRVTTNEDELAAATNEETPNTLAKRDADGRMRAADPVDPQDVVTKNWVEGSTGQDLSTNGYTTLPGGLIIQWFEYDTGSLSNNSSFSVNFPIQFPSSALQVILSDTSGTTDAGATSTEGAKVDSFNSSSVTCLSAWQSSNQTVRFIAIGY